MGVIFLLDAFVYHLLGAPRRRLEFLLKMKMSWGADASQRLDCPEAKRGVNTTIAAVPGSDQRESFRCLRSKPHLPHDEQRA